MIPFLKCTGVKSFSSLQDGELRWHDAPLVIQFDFSGQKAGAIKRYFHKFANETVAIRISILASTVMREFWARTGESFSIFAEKKRKETKNKTTTTLLLRCFYFRGHAIFSMFTANTRVSWESGWRCGHQSHHTRYYPRMWAQFQSITTDLEGFP